MTIDQVYDALNTLLKAVSVPTPAGTYTLESKALVIPCFSLKGKHETWGGQLRSTKDGGQIHAWFFTQTGSQVPAERTRQGQQHATWVITVYGYLGLRAGSHTDNSDLDMQREANSIEKALNADPHGMPTILRDMRPFRLERDVVLLGQELAHRAVGNLLIQSC